MNIERTNKAKGNPIENRKTLMLPKPKTLTVDTFEKNICQKGADAPVTKIIIIA